MKHFWSVTACLLAAIGIVMVSSLLFPSIGANVNLASTGLFSQSVTAIHLRPSTQYVLYDGATRIGVLSSREKLDHFLQKEYEHGYAESFPDTSLSLGKDLYLTREQSYFSYRNADEDIFSYLKENHLFSIGAVKVTMSGDDSISGQIYVTDRELFLQALHSFLELFVSSDDLDRLERGQTLPALSEPGEQTTGIAIGQKITYAKAAAPVDEVMTSTDEVLNWLEYGPAPEKTYYTVEEGDSLAGVGAKNGGLSARQVMMLNKDAISDPHQYLTPGQKLNVTYLSSALTVTVTKVRLVKEEVPFATHYIEDETVAPGSRKVLQEGVSGERSVLYQETWTNGVLIKGSYVSERDDRQAVDEVVAVAPGEAGKLGTGNFIWPVDNAAIACGWADYSGHEALDIINVYNRYVDVRAADAGIVEANGYDQNRGNYLVIDHGNGLYSCYGHLNEASSLPAGSTVQRGEVIGQIGTSGNATAPALSFYISVQQPDNSQNPCDGYLDCTGYAYEN